MISIVIPTHNRCDMLVRAINSVLSQKIDEEIEIIVVSDGSTDKTKEVVSNIKCPFIKFIEYFPSKNGNYARNLGIKNSTGKYIAFLDDDDEWLPGKLDAQIKLMRQTNNALSYTLSNIIYVNEKITYSTKLSNSGDLSRAILQSNLIGSTSTVIVEKRVLENSGFFDEDMPALQDYDLWIRVCQHTNVDCVNYPLLNYLANKCLRNNNRKMARKYSFILLKNGYFKLFLKFYICSFLNYKSVLKLRSSV